MELEQNNNHNTELSTDEIKQSIALKRVASHDESTVEIKKPKPNENGNDTTINETAQLTPTTSQSPKKRLQIFSPTQKRPKWPHKKDDNCIYGNYRCYFSKRTGEQGFSDIRLDMMGTKPELFRGKQLLDIGCNAGELSMELAKRFEVKSLVGLDIDKKLAHIAQNTLTKFKRGAPPAAIAEAKKHNRFPFNVKFMHANYVLVDDVLLEIEEAQFDVILCLSVTKWIHLNFGDAGLKQAFRRMFLQLRAGGTLILEPQPFHTYKRRKRLNDTIRQNYDAIQFKPADFTKYLLSAEVGFASVTLLGTPDHIKDGFKRPIEIYTKALAI